MTSRFDATRPRPAATAASGAGWRRTASDGRIASISPAMDGPANKGHTCVKGRFAHQFARSRDRLTAPLVRESGGFRLASWDEAIGRIADALGRIKAEHGPDAIAGLASSRATNEDCYVMQRLMRAAIGTHNIDNCSRVCHSPTSFALRKSFGMSGATGSFDDIEAAEVALLIGVNPTQGHPVVGAAHQAGRDQGPEARSPPTRAGSSSPTTASSTSARGRAPTRRCSTAWRTW